MKKFLLFLVVFIGMSAVAQAQTGLTVSLANNGEAIVNIPTGYRLVFPFKDVASKTYYVVVRPESEFDIKTFKVYSGSADKPFSELPINSSTNQPGSMDYTFITSAGTLKFTRSSPYASQEKDGKEIRLEKISQ